MNKKRMLLIVCFQLIFFVLSSGCFSKQNQVVTHEIPFRHYIRGVPFIRQKPYYCAPASAEMVLKFYGITKFTQDDIAKCDSANRKGTHWKKLVHYINWNGKKDKISAQSIYGDMQLLKNYVASDQPVLVRQWTDLDKKSKHYRIVVGYDDETKKILCVDPHKGPNYRMDYDSFLDMWDIRSSSHKWTSKNLMIIISKEK